MSDKPILHKLLNPLLVVLLLMLVGACGSFNYHKVRKEETLYSISWRYGEDYKKIAEWNRIKPPYIIHEGDRLRITPIDSASQTIVSDSGRTASRQSQPGTKPGIKTLRAPVPKNNVKPPLQTIPSEVHDSEEVQANRKLEQGIPNRKLVWNWPVSGKLISTYSGKGVGGKGIDIAGKKGAPVKAAAYGRVVYSGSGLQHYGKLIIIKHNAKFLSAYAHNRKLLVSEGVVVQKGQKIAEMGQTGTGINRIMLHFEIRADGIPVNPLSFLPAREM